MENVRKNTLGLSTTEALRRLQSAIKEELQKNEFSYSINSWMKDSYYHKSSNCTFAWTSAVGICLEVMFLLIFQVYVHEKSRSLAAETIFLVFFLLVNIFIVAWDNFLKHSEMRNKVKTILQILEENANYSSWEIGHYSNLHTPMSPCISVQWTCRDNHIVNLPCSLLVEGDVILLRPGHAAPGKCKPIEMSTSQPPLQGGQVFAPVDEHFNENFNSPQLRKPGKVMEFIMLESPLILNVRCALENSLKRPVTLFNKECHAVVFHYLERIVIPITLVITLFVGCIHTIYFDSKSSDWAEHLLLRPALALMPLLPLAFPTCWIFLNAYGNAHLLAFVCSSKKNISKPVDPFDEIEETHPPLLEQAVRWNDLKKIFIALLLGKNGYLWRSANLLQVLGSITTLCCVDKKGILSWPNPTAEKVFFLKSLKSKSNSEVSTHMCNESGDADQEGSDSKEEVMDLKRLIKLNKKLDVKDHMYHPGSLVEVLDLTHNLHSPFGIQFDDPNWKLFIGNLKPLGLGILLNTCNPKTQEHYTKFSDHIACESLFNDAAVPIVNKRCLCELAKQIGFSDSVVDFYELEQQLGIFRHVHPEVVQKGKLARSLNFPRLKMPFPNISCAVVKDLHRGSYQLFSQGTADLVLDACNEYWDGEDICVLTELDRKRILDFYHRSSLTAHCMGYAYGPLNEALNENFSGSYIELPSEGYHLFSALKTTTSSPRSWDLHCSDSGAKQHSLNRYLSSDSLMMLDQEEKLDDLYLGTKTCLHQLGNEIFIGMVTMQYQACPDFVQLIEQLDKACIRFVHFSKENELRSRVFSEKMGLESGWNCHISLLSDDKCSKKGKESVTITPSPFEKHYSTQDTSEDFTLESKIEVPARHASAPSIINLETTVVKFEEEISTHSRSEDSISVYNSISHRLGETCFMTDPDFSGRKSISAMEDIFIAENISHSPSHVTESTDQSAPVTFDMSNRAKLPKGTENIRPHIANVDNVPLQVSLFTDCTAEATREMICIMQENGEVVCCLGSSANSQNMRIFLQADASIGIEPLHPQQCMQQPVFDSKREKGSLSPAGLSSLLNGLPCGLTFHREDPVSLYHLILEARHFMGNVRNGLQFMLCCCLSITLFQVLAMFFFLPTPLPLAHILWMACLQIPLLSLSLVATPLDSGVMALATGKNLEVANKQAFFFFLACYCAKFCPSVIVSISCFACIIGAFCSLYPDSGTDPCWMFLTSSEKKSPSASLESWIGALALSQNVVSFFFVLYFVLISMGFVHRSCMLWRSSPFANRYWTATAALVLLLQFLFNAVDVTLHVTGGEGALTLLGRIPSHVWLVAGLWPLLLIPLDGMVKRHEVKVNVRQQKRARLEFCTKLGMNSPF